MDVRLRDNVISFVSVRFGVNTPTYTLPSFLDCTLVLLTDQYFTSSILVVFTLKTRFFLSYCHDSLDTFGLSLQTKLIPR